MPMYVYVVVIICFCPFFFIEIFTPSHVKIKFTRCCCCCIVLHICIPAYKPYILFFLIPFNKNFTTNQPTNHHNFGCLKISFILQKERRLASQKIFQLTTDKGGNNNNINININIIYTQTTYRLYTHQGYNYIRRNTH